MRMLVALSVFILLIACGDGNPLQPTEETTLSPGPTEVSVAAKPGGVKMVPFKGKGFMEPGSARAPTEEESAACLAAGGVSVDAAVLSMNVTHMGKAEYRFWDCWSEDYSILFYHGTVIAANGDELYFYGPMEGEWEIWEVDWMADPIPWRFGPMTITGGTGRFEDVTGSFMAWGWSVFEPGIGWYGTENWDGMISSVGTSN